MPVILVLENGHTPLFPARASTQAYGTPPPGWFFPKKECPLSYLRGHLLNKQTLTQFYLYRVFDLSFMLSLQRSNFDSQTKPVFNRLSYPLCCLNSIAMQKYSRFSILWLDEIKYFMDVLVLSAYICTSIHTQLHNNQVFVSIFKACKKISCSSGFLS